MQGINLTQNQITLVDDEDFKKLNQFYWCATWNPSTQSFYAERRKLDKIIFMARFIMNCPENLLVDHRNHNTLDNQKNNLRTCTVIENARNSRPQQGTTSKYKGVTWDVAREKWVAQIQLQNIFNRSFHKGLGRFEDEIEAALAYDKIALEEFGEFAYLNFQL